ALSLCTAFELTLCSLIMRTYKRIRTCGATYFFTVALATRRNTTPLIDHIPELRAAFRAVLHDHAFELQAIVVLPYPPHCLWSLPQGDDDFPMRWRLIKSSFSQALPSDESISCSRRRKAERGIWQRRYWEHLIRDELDWQRHVDYIHYNPVKHGY